MKKASCSEEIELGLEPGLPQPQVFLLPLPHRCMTPVGSGQHMSVLRAGVSLVRGRAGEIHVVWSEGRWIWVGKHLQPCPS